MEQPPAKVLIIDDEPAIRDLLRRGLAGPRYKVTAVASGVAAVEAAKIERFDVALCDLMMPVMDGQETLKALKKIDSGIEVVMITGHATFENAVEAMRNGAYDYIPKPFELDQIRAVIARALERGRLAERVVALEQLDQLKSEFLANMSHEFHTPLNAIMGYTSLVLDGIYGAVPQAQAPALERVKANAQNLNMMINDLLDYSKLAAGLMPVQSEEVDVSGIVREAADVLRPLAEEKGLALAVEAEDMILIRSDRDKIKQIVLALGGNAVKFASRGRVSVRVDADGAGGAVLAVSDTGPGIEPEDVPMIFQEFRQLEGSWTRRYGGTGLGLTLVKKLVQILGGTISVESSPGLGSNFTVKLPRASGVRSNDALVEIRTQAGH